MLRRASVCFVIVGLLSGIGRPVAAQGRVDATASFAVDSTLVVLVPATTDAAGALGAVRALRDEDVAAVYTTDDPAARRLARALSETVGGALIPYDRAGMTNDAFAELLVRNAVGANPRRAVVVVVEPSLVDLFFRGAAIAAGVDVGPAGAPGGAA